MPVTSTSTVFIPQLPIELEQKILYWSSGPSSKKIHDLHQHVMKELMEKEHYLTMCYPPSKYSPLHNDGYVFATRIPALIPALGP